MAEYIEREALIARLRKVCSIENDFGCGVLFGNENAINCIKEAPAADVVEVKRGASLFYCHNCGCWISPSDERTRIFNKETKNKENDRELLIELIRLALMDNIGKPCNLPISLADYLINNGVVIVKEK